MNNTLLKYKDELKLKSEGEKTYVFDPIRKKYLVLQPEEFVRQLVVLFLIDQGYPIQKIQVEKVIQLNQMVKRFDVVVYDDQIKPFLLIECKAPHIKIDQKVLDQIARYNLEIKAPYIMITNGQESLYLEPSDQKAGVAIKPNLPKYPNR